MMFLNSLFGGGKTPLLLRALCAALILLPALAHAQEEATGLTQDDGTGLNFMERWGDQRVTVADNKNRQRRLILIRVIADKLEYTPPGSGGAVVEVPLQSMQETQFLYPYPRDFAQARTLAGRGQYKEAANILRPDVYPAVKFMSVPPKNLNVHELVKFYLELLVADQNWLEAAHIISNLPLDDLHQDFLDMALTVAGELIKLEKPKTAVSLLNQVPFNAENASFFPKLMRFADLLRSGGYYDDALTVYQRIHNVPDTDEYTASTLWVAYCHLRMERVEAARLFLNRIEELAPGDNEFALLELVLARFDLVDDNFSEALKHASRGVVYSKMADDWAPETLFLSAQCYEEFRRMPQAKSIYKQIELFFPNSNWGTRSSERLEILADVSDNPGGGAVGTEDDLLEFDNVLEKSRETGGTGDAEGGEAPAPGEEPEGDQPF